MEKKIIISKDNKKAIAIINSIRERKKALREFMLAEVALTILIPLKACSSQHTNTVHKKSGNSKQLLAVIKLLSPIIY